MDYKIKNIIITKAIFFIFFHHSCCNYPISLKNNINIGFLIFYIYLSENRIELQFYANITLNVHLAIHHT